MKYFGGDGGRGGKALPSLTPVARRRIREEEAQALNTEEPIRNKVLNCAKGLRKFYHSFFVQQTPVTSIDTLHIHGITVSVREVEVTLLLLSTKAEGAARLILLRR